MNDMNSDDTTSDTTLRRLPPIWVTTLVAGIILLSIFIPYRKKLNNFSAPVIQAIQQIALTDS